MPRALSHGRRVGEAVALAVSLALPAGAAEPRALLRLAAHWTQPSDDVGADAGTLEFEAGVGLTASFEVLLRPRLGVELSYASLHHDLLRRTAGSDSDLHVGAVRMTPWTLMLNFHSQLGTRSNLYFGAGLAYTEFGDLELRGPAGSSRRDRVDDDLVAAAQVALDHSLGARLGLTAGCRYFESKVDTGSLVLPVKPWIGWIGVRIRFGPD